MRFKTAVGQAAMVNGHRHDRADGILVDERASRFTKGRGRGNLYILVEVSGQAFNREAFAGRLAEVVRDVYYSQQGSVTASLQKAIREANSLLVEENRHSMPGDRQAAGISCAVLRNEDLFLAQAGPAAVYVTHEAQPTRFPEVSPWLDGISLEEADAAPMGERRDVRVDLFHLRVTDADTILLVDSNTARRVSRRAWLEILSTSSVEAMREALLVVAEGGDLSALMVSLGEGATKGVPALPPMSSQVPVHEPVSAPVQEPAVQDGVPLKPSQRTGTLKQALAAFGAWFLLFFRRLVPGPPSPQQTPRRQATIVSKSEGGKGAKQARSETKRKGRGNLLQKLLIVLAIAIPLVVAGIVAYSVNQRNRAQEAELEDLWLEAQAQWVQTQATSDPATVREMLAKAEDSLAQLLERKPDHAGALQLREKIQARLEETSQVRRVHWEGDLATYPANADLTRLVVEGAHLFVMDRNAHSVYHHELDEFQQALKPDTLDTVLVRKGDRVGNVLVGDLVDMTWMPVGFGRQKAGLVILDSEGTLLEYDPATGELILLRVAAPETWQLPELVGSHSGRFYVLDSVANKIWRYGPTPDGYSSPPTDWLEAAIDLTGVKDMAVGDSIFLLYADGRIEKLTAGEVDTFDISDWDIPPRAPSTLFTRPPNDTQWVYVADRGNSRVVQSDKAGLFKRQFRLADSGQGSASDPLGGVTSLFVDEIGGRAYYLSGHQLYMMILPD